MRRRTAVLLVLCATLAAAFVGAPGALAQEGPCTEQARAAFPDAGGHLHADVAQHGFSCRMRQVFFDSLADELGARPDLILGEMDVKADLAAVAVTYPESGVLLFDVSDPATPRFLSWYRGEECDQALLDVNCGAFVDLSSDGKLAFLAIQTFTPFPIGRGTPERPRLSIQGVQVLDLADPARPRLAGTYPVVSQGGVHTARSHVIPAGTGPRDPGEYVFSIANGVGIDIARVERDGGDVNLVAWNTILIGDAHDTFIQDDPITGRTYLYIAEGFQLGFSIWDVTDPGDVDELARWDLTPECGEDWYAHTIDVTNRDGRRYVTMPAEILDLGEQLEEDQAEGCGRVWGNGDQPGPLWIVDASDLGRLGQPGDSQETLKAKSAATLVTTWTNPAGRAGGHLTFSPHNQQIVGDRIFLSHYHAGVFALDASAAFAGRGERPAEIGFVVPHGAETRPFFEPAFPPLQPFFSEHAGVRPDVWDMVFYKGHVLAADMRGGLYSFALEEPAAPAEPRLRLALRLRFRARRTGAGRCATGDVTARLTGRDVGRVRRVDFLAGRRRVASDRRHPFRAVVRRNALRRGRVNTLRARVVLRDGRRVTVSRRVRAC